MAELVRTYEDARLDPADVSVVAIAERVGCSSLRRSAPPPVAAQVAPGGRRRTGGHVPAQADNYG
jgi:hypothetical protein